MNIGAVDNGDPSLRLKNGSARDDANRRMMPAGDSADGEQGQGLTMLPNIGVIPKPRVFPSGARDLDARRLRRLLKNRCARDDAEYIGYNSASS
jgi:hypothetical protein